MASPLRAEDERIEVVPFVVFALILLVPLLNFRFTFYHTTLKLFVFQTAATVVWGTLLWEWAAGRLRWAEWPAWWLFAPLGLWVAWGLATALWSPMPAMAGRWVVQGFYGFAGALGLALLLRDVALRRTFVVAASVVVFVVAAWMVVQYGDARSGFFGEIGMTAREVGAAFLLVPTLVAAAVLYGRAGGDAADVEGGYLRIIWATVVLVVLVAAGVRADSAGWTYGLGAGLVVAVWLLLPRWRLAAVVLAVLVVVLGAGREGRLGQRAEGDAWREETREALLDRAEWSMVGGSSLGTVVAGHGAGTFMVALDRTRPRSTYAMSLGDKVEGHARRGLTEVLYERGLAGAALALAAGLACVAAGVLAFARARDRGDAALGAGVAAGVVALGVYALLANGSACFGATMAFWVGVGLLGALSIRCGRPVGLSWSAEEELGRKETAGGRGAARAAAAVAAGLVAVALWLVLGAWPFWAGYSLREGRAELDMARSFAAERERAAGALRSLRRTPGQSAAEFQEVGQRAKDNLQRATALHDESVARARRTLERAAALSLDGRVWLNAQLSLARSELARGEAGAAAERYARLDQLCGPVFDLDLLRAACCERLGKPGEAHRLYRRYAAKNPLAAHCTLFRTKTNLYEPWFRLIETERRKPQPDPAWRAWAWDFIDACSEGLAVYPDHYALLMLNGEMFYRLGRDEESFDLMTAAANVIRHRLAVRPYSPLIQAQLLLEWANALIHWDKQKALTVVNQIGTLNIDFTDPVYRPVLNTARDIIMALDPAAARQARQAAARRAEAAAPRAPARPPARPASRAPATRTQP